MDGILLLNKEIGDTSFQAINKANKFMKQKEKILSIFYFIITVLYKKYTKCIENT